MRCALALGSAVLLGACASAPSRTAIHSGDLTVSTGQPGGIPLVRGRGDLPFREARAAVARLSGEYAALRIAATDSGATVEDVVQLPLTTKAADVATLVVFAVFHGRVRVGATETRSDAELSAATSAFTASPGTVALLRVDDEAELDDVVHVAKALDDLGIAVRVLGSVGPGEPAPREWGSDCQLPAGADLRGSDSVVVKVLVDDDGQGRAGVVHLPDTPPSGFAWAAAVCATLNRFQASSAPAGQPRVGRPLAIKFLP
jgi:hypothetical protein